MLPFEKEIDKGLQELAKEPVEASLITEFLARRKNVSKRKSPLKNPKLRLAFAGGSVALLIIASIFIPATYTVTVGSIVKAEFQIPDGIEPATIVLATPTFPNSRKMFSIRNETGELTIAGKDLNSESATKALEQSLKTSFPGLEGLKVTAEPIREHRGGNALAAITGGRIEIGVGGMSDAEIEASITQALMSSGMTVHEVNVSTTSPEEGRIERRVEIRAGSENGAEAPEIELMLDGDEEAGDNQQERVIIRKEIK